MPFCTKVGTMMFGVFAQYLGAFCHMEVLGRISSNICCNTLRYYGYALPNIMFFFHQTSYPTQHHFLYNVKQKYENMIRVAVIIAS